MTHNQDFLEKNSLGEDDPFELTSSSEIRRCSIVTTYDKKWGDYMLWGRFGTGSPLAPIIPVEAEQPEYVHFLFYMVEKILENPTKENAPFKKSEAFAGVIHSFENNQLVLACDHDHVFSCKFKGTDYPDHRETVCENFVSEKDNQIMYMTKDGVYNYQPGQGWWQLFDGYDMNLGIPYKVWKKVQ